MGIRRMGGRVPVFSRSTHELKFVCFSGVRSWGEGCTWSVMLLRYEFQYTVASKFKGGMLEEEAVLVQMEWDK